MSTSYVPFSTLCSKRRVGGPAAYYQCLANELEMLERTSGRPDLSRLGSADREMIEGACASKRRIGGPAAYYQCLDRQVSLLVP